MSTAELTKIDKADVVRAASTVKEMLLREAGNHPLREVLCLQSHETRLDDGSSMMLARMPNNAIAVQVFRTGDDEATGPGYGVYPYGEFTVTGTLIMTIGCFFEGGDGFWVRNNITRETLEFPANRLPDAIAAACRMLRGIK